MNKKNSEVIRRVKYGVFGAGVAAVVILSSLTVPTELGAHSVTARMETVAIPAATVYVATNPVTAPYYLMSHQPAVMHVIKDVIHSIL